MFVIDSPYEALPRKEGWPLDTPACNEIADYPGERTHRLGERVVAAPRTGRPSAALRATPPSRQVACELVRPEQSHPTSEPADGCHAAMAIAGPSG
jgi:hypothetical protein